MTERLDIDRETKLLIEKFGYDRVASAVKKASLEGSRDTLTIISNQGLHDPPQEYLFGELYYVTKGQIKFTSIEDVERILDTELNKLVEKLKEKRWNKIYLVPFGHVVINMHVKMAVFRTLWIDTVDIFYFGNSRYGLLERDTRNALID